MNHLSKQLKLSDTLKPSPLAAALSIDPRCLPPRPPLYCPLILLPCRGSYEVPSRPPGLPVVNHDHISTPTALWDQDCHRASTGNHQSCHRVSLDHFRPRPNNHRIQAGPSEVCVPPGGIHQAYRRTYEVSVGSRLCLPLQPLLLPLRSTPCSTTKGCPGSSTQPPL